MLPNLAVRLFQSFLQESWDSAQEFLGKSEETVGLVDDWLQANWELLVEAAVCPEPGQFLEFYGEGADCNGASSRVWMPEAQPTHRIYCVPKEGGAVLDVLTAEPIAMNRWAFGQLVNWDGERYGQGKPFDHVLLEHRDEIAIVSCADVAFEIGPIPANK